MRLLSALAAALDRLLLPADSISRASEISMTSRLCFEVTLRAKYEATPTITSRELRAPHAACRMQHAACSKIANLVGTIEELRGIEDECG